MGHQVFKIENIKNGMKYMYNQIFNYNIHIGVILKEFQIFPKIIEFGLLTCLNLKIILDSQFLKIISQRKKNRSVLMNFGMEFYRQLNKLRKNNKNVW